MKYALFLLLFVTCNQDKPVSAIQAKQTGEVSNLPVNKKSYEEVKKRSAALLKAYRQEPTLQAEKDMNTFVADSLIPYWYGTTWNFYGTTETPGKGSIACGYFVTTVLRDAGMRINRSKLAQCASEIMIQQLSIKHSVQRFRNVRLESFIEEILQEQPGLYIVGLDYHTGFLFNYGREIYFIHASYATPKMVIMEKANESGILASSKYKVIGKVNFL